MSKYAFVSITLWAYTWTKLCTLTLKDVWKNKSQNLHVCQQNLHRRTYIKFGYFKEADLVFLRNNYNSKNLIFFNHMYFTPTLVNLSFKKNDHLVLFSDHLKIQVHLLEDDIGNCYFCNSKQIEKIAFFLKL